MNVIDTFERKFPYMYFSVRKNLLFFIILTSIIWVIFGFDSTIHSTFNFGPTWTIGSNNENYGLGLHWSTIQNYLILIYVGFIAFGEGNLNLKILIREIKKDFNVWRHYNKRKELRKDIVNKNSFTYGFIYSFLIATSSLFIFEVIWVFFYNYFQFGDWFYPVYRTMMMDPLNISYPLLRNSLFALLIIPLAFAAILFPTIKINKDFKALYKVKLRLNKYTYIFIILALLSWSFWIFYPFEHNTKEFNDLDFEKDVYYSKNMTLIRDPSLYAYPKQDEYFPNTCYTFYNISTMEKNRIELDEILGFYVNDDPVHTVNVLTKYISTLAICYPFFLFVQKREK